MSYYVTLPSNGADLKSEYGILNNTQTDYEIELKNPLNFTYKNYEVGLSEFSCNMSWLMPLGKFTIINTQKKFDDIELNISISDGILVTGMIEILKSRFDQIFLRNEVNLLDNNIIFNYENATNSFIIHVPDGWELKIEGFFATFLKYIKSMYFDGSEQIIKYSTDCIKIKGVASCVLTKNKINYINELYIYTNIIENQHVGSDMVKLLKVVNVKGFNGDNISHIFDFPHYLSLDTNYIDIIRIYIRDCYGNKIRFNDEHSKVFVKLHFKPKYLI